MWHTGREHKNFSFTDINYPGLTVFLDFYLYIALKLKEKFFSFVVVIILAGIRTTHHHHNKILIGFINYFIADRRFKEMAIFVDPFFKREGRGDRHEGWIMDYEL